MFLIHKPYIFFLSEPMTDFFTVHISFWDQLQMKFIAFNTRLPLIPNIWCLCKCNLNISFISCSNQFVVCSILVNRHVIYLAAIYASTSHIIRRQLWLDLTSLQSQYIGAWCFTGDFNCILGAQEKRMCIIPSQFSCTCLDRDLLFDSSSFLWSFLHLVK